MPYRSPTHSPRLKGLDAEGGFPSNSPEPAHTFAPTLDNSDASPANSDGNSNTLSIAINTPPETFPHHSWPHHTFLTLYPSLPDPSRSIMMSSEQPTPPTDPIRIPLWPALGSYPTPVNSTQLLLGGPKPAPMPLQTPLPSPSPAELAAPAELPPHPPPPNSTLQDEL
ncbi:hypothetical protein E4T56_gene19590 [Termitomyces sp. T112]|nr:hypothetical protein E4T56_gene19590 [Termitomyces sp. T112]